MIKDTARLIITRECPRHCSYCANKNTSVVSGARKISSLLSIKDFPNVAITGGEPLINVTRLCVILGQLRAQGHKNIYLYTAMYTKEYERFAGLVDGITYTVHANAQADDVAMFHWMQARAGERKVSCRLVVHKNNRLHIPLRPSWWESVTLADWNSPDTCELPPNEELFELVSLYG